MSRYGGVMKCQAAGGDRIRGLSDGTSDVRRRRAAERIIDAACEVGRQPTELFGREGESDVQRNR